MIQEQDYSIIHLQQGVPEAFKILYFEYYPEFLSFSEKLLQDRSRAKQATTDAFFLLWNRHMDFDNERKIKAFLYLAVRNNCLRFLQYPLRESPRQQIFVYDIPSSLPNAVVQDILDYNEKTA